MTLRANSGMVAERHVSRCEIIQLPIVTGNVAAKMRDFH
jgi:hypothetical protein